MSNYKTLLRQLAPQLVTHYDIDGAPNYLPIVPSSRLWLPHLGIGDDKRFAAIFRNTWRKLPFRDRRMMVMHWRMCEPFRIREFWSPYVALSDDWTFFDGARRHPKDIAACGHSGHVLFFHASVVDTMPAVHVEELIAHELAHVIQHANGEMPQTDRSVPRCLDDSESDADEIMEQWGFEPSAMDKWIAAEWKWPNESEA